MNLRRDKPKNINDLHPLQFQLYDLPAATIAFDILSRWLLDQDPLDEVPRASPYSVFLSPFFGKVDTAGICRVLSPK
jgi:hypothetical protein